MGVCKNPYRRRKSNHSSNTRSNLCSRRRIRVSIESYMVLTGHIRDIRIESNMGSTRVMGQFIRVSLLEHLGDGDLTVAGTEQLSSI